MLSSAMHSTSQQVPAVRLFVGSHAKSVQGEPQTLTGDRCFTAAHAPQSNALDVSKIAAILDSGAFSDKPEKRLTPEQALQRQLRWEARASEKWGTTFRAYAFVSYDYLIDETWVLGQKHKRRWGVVEADRAVKATVESAHYLASQRETLYPRKLMLACQGVDSVQYAECVDEVLSVAQPADWIALGGWCILGLFSSWLPTFWATLQEIVPRIASAGVRHIHILGVLYQPALGGLLWLADEHGITVSTDSAAPILACTRGNPTKAGVRAEYWRDNVAWWVAALANLRETAHYKRPPHALAMRQTSFLEASA